MNEALRGASILYAPRPLHVELIEDADRLAALGPEWEALNALRSDHEAPFFQSHAWSMHVVRTRLQRSAHRYRLRTAAVHEGERLIGVWPLSLQRIAGVWIAKSLDDPFGQLAGVLFATKEAIGPGVAATLAALKDAGVADGMQIDNVVEGTPLYQALLERGARDSVSNDAVYVDMRGCASFAEFSEGVNKKTRKNLRNLLNRLKRNNDEVQHTIADQRLGIRPMLEGAFAARVEWMQEHARTSPAFRDPDFRAIVEGLAEAPNVDLLGFCLALGQTALSTQWGFSYLDRYYAYMSGKNARFDEYSPGRMHLGMVIEACKLRGIDVLELMAPASDYKLTWSNNRRRLHSLVLPFTIKGYVLLTILAGKLVPAMRGASRLLPPAVRKSLVNALLRCRFR